VVRTPYQEGEGGGGSDENPGRERQHTYIDFINCENRIQTWGGIPGKGKEDLHGASIPSNTMENA